VNFLAHIYLSGEDPEVQLGNFMADAVKGNQYQRYSPGIQRGILLHRFIDSYTDAHPVFRQSKSRLHGKQFGHYTGVIMDMFYDHFLAANWAEFHHQTLEDFTGEFYQLITQQKNNTPERTQHLIPYMIEQNWLMQYRSIEGLDLILGQMNRRTKGRSNMDQAAVELRQDYRAFETEFYDFFQAVQGEAAAELRRLYF
jgi:acyl carrier protein phosphodiesterase